MNHKNFAYGTVLTAPSPAASGTSLTLNAGQGALMPAVPFQLVVWPINVQPLNSNAEIVTVTARATDVLTITRAQESTDARAIVVGDQCSGAITSQMLTQVEMHLEDGAATISTGTVRFSNLNGVSFGFNGQTVTASHNGLTTAALSNHSHGNPQLNLTNLSGTTASNSAGLTLSLSAAAPVPSFSAGVSNVGNTAGDTGVSGTRFVLVGSQNITLSQATDANGLTVSISGGAGAAGNTGFLSAGGATASLGTVVFSNSHGVSFGFNGQTVTASHNGLTTAMLSNAATLSNLRVSAGTTSNLLSALTFADGNGVSFGLNASIVTASHNGLTSQSNQNVTAANGGFAFQTLSFSNVNGVSFGTSAGSALTASHNGLTTARASTDALGLATAATNVTWTANSAGVSLNAAGYAGTTTTFVGANISASFTFNSAGLNMSASVAAPGAAAENNAIHLLGANTSGNTTATGSTIGWSGINLTLSGTNGSVVNISAPATSSLSATGQVSLSTNGSTISIGVPNALTLSYWNPQDAYLQVAGQQGQGSLHFQPAQAPNVQYDRLLMPIVNTNSSNSSGSHTLSFWVGLYTRNISTLSLLGSTSMSTAVTHSGTVGSYSLYSGIRFISIGSTRTLEEGQYFFGILSRTTSGGANGTYSQLLASQGNSSFFGHFGVATNQSMQYTRGLGVYTATTSGIPNSVAFSDISGAGNSLVLRQPVFYVVSQTI